MSGIGGVNTYLAPNHRTSAATNPVDTAPASDAATPAGILPNAPDRLTISSAAPPLSIDMITQLLNAQAERTGG